MGTPRILIVEDDEIIALDISETVSRFGYEVVGVANTASQAMKMAESQKPDLALMDISLRGSVDGIAVAEQMRSHWSIPVVFLTAHGDRETIARTAGNGAFGHLTKPIRVEELRAAISIALRQHHALNDLLQSNAWLSALLGSITEGVLAVDQDGRLIYLNAQAESLTAWSLADAYGRPVEEVLTLYSQEGRPLAQLRVKAAANTQTGMPQERFLLRRHDGKEILVAETTSPLWSGDRCLGALSVIRDLSDVIKFEEAQKWETIGVLAAGVAHDFNNLLAVVIGNTQLAMETLPDSSREVKFLQSAFVAGQKAAELTSQLLAYAGKSVFRRRTVDFKQTVRDISGSLKTAIPENIELSIDLPDRLPKINGDPTQIQQVVKNLVINAAEAIGDDPGSIDVLASAAELDQGILFSVRDNGPGMNAETRSKIFDPFFSTKFLGRGLGLAAVQGIVRSHEGTIDVETAPGKGSTFTMFFPALDNHIQKGQPETSANEARGSETVLVVDDSEAVSKFVKTSLERFGFSVIVANNGRRAFEDLARDSFRVDLVLLDLSMPILSGSETARLIRQQFPETPICFMSGYNETIAEAEIPDRQGPRCFLQKPFTADQLVAKIRTVLSAKRYERDPEQHAR